MESFLTKAVERLGRKRLWLLVYTVRRLSAAESTVDGVREALRSVELFVDDDEFSRLVAPFVLGDGRAFDTAAFVRALIATLPPRRQHVLRLVVRKVDPNETGFVSFETLRAAYDVLRHPHVLLRDDPHELVDEFLANFEEARGDDNNGITTDELVAYYVGISLTTPRDEDFELLCIRSYSLDRPQTRLGENPPMSLSRQRRSLRMTVGGGPGHALYQTTAMEYGKGCENVAYDGKFSRNHCFTKYAPMQNSGGATSMNM